MSKKGLIRGYKDQDDLYLADFLIAKHYEEDGAIRGGAIG
jgi:GDP-D-mannose dehydratase